MVTSDSSLIMAISIFRKNIKYEEKCLAVQVTGRDPTSQSASESDAGQTTDLHHLANRSLNFLINTHSNVLRSEVNNF